MIVDVPCSDFMYFFGNYIPLWLIFSKLEKKTGNAEHRYQLDLVFYDDFMRCLKFTVSLSFCICSAIYFINKI